MSTTINCIRAPVSSLTPKNIYKRSDNNKNTTSQWLMKKVFIYFILLFLDFPHKINLFLHNFAVVSWYFPRWEMDFVLIFQGCINIFLHKNINSENSLYG